LLSIRSLIAAKRRPARRRALVRRLARACPATRAPRTWRDTTPEP